MVCLGLLVSLPIQLWSSAELRPNVIVLLADDLGCGDLGCYGGPVRTPRIDQLAAEGMRFTQFYSGASTCSPSRATLLTGRNHVRTGVYSWIKNDEQRSHLQESELTIAERLRPERYATAHIGKWHLGMPVGDVDKPTPSDHGFDFWFATENNAFPSHRNPENFLRNGAAVGDLKGYSCQLVVDEAIRWLENRSSDDCPFFMNLWFHEPHAPLAAPMSLVEGYGDPLEKASVYSGAVENMDRAIGRLLDALPRFATPEETLIVFASDNGSYLEDRVGGLRGSKGHNWEGGIRVPGIFCWPGVIPAGAVAETPAGLVDLLPTLCGFLEIDEGGAKPWDGADLSGVLKSKDPLPLLREQPLFWYSPRSRPVIALRKGRWSLVADPDRDLPHPNKFQESWIPLYKETGYANFELFDLESDPAQKVDLLVAKPEVGRELKGEMLRLSREIMREGVDYHLQP